MYKRFSIYGWQVQDTVIKLERSDRPNQLTDEVVKSLTDKFKTTKARVWDKSYIKSGLLEMSHGKCCYCEIQLTEESKYMTVDHFHHKDSYPDEVVDWDNLLPCCNLCNSTKSSHDTYINPIINPTIDNPQQHLYFHFLHYCCRNNSVLGANTISVLNLNSIDKRLVPRFKISTEIMEQLENLWGNVSNYIPDTRDVRPRNKIVNSITGLLRRAQPEHEYSALAATIILECEYYKNIKERLIELDLWDDTLTVLEQSAKSICLSQYDI